jgi:2'-5' RNA ligase
MPFRAFVAVPMPALAPVDALLKELSASPADLKVVQPGNLHLTVSFLGQLGDDAPARAESALRRAADGASPFVVPVRGVGAFPNPRRPRVVWAGLVEAEPLRELAQRARRELESEGLRGDDKPFRAHVTLARVREGGSTRGLPEFLAGHAEDDLGELRVDELRLYRSHLSPKGPAYEAVARVPLGVV